MSVLSEASADANDEFDIYTTLFDAERDAYVRVEGEDTGAARGL